jgi:hypothetical protein
VRIVRYISCHTHTYLISRNPHTWCICVHAHTHTLSLSYTHTHTHTHTHRQHWKSWLGDHSSFSDAMYQSFLTIFFRFAVSYNVFVTAFSSVVYVYIHIRIYVYTYIRIYVYTYIHIYVYTYIHVYIYTFIHLYIYTFFRFGVSYDVFVRAQVCVSACILYIQYLYTLAVCVHIYTHWHTCISHTHTNQHTRTPIHMFSEGYSDTDIQTHM